MIKKGGDLAQLRTFPWTTDESFKTKKNTSGAWLNSLSLSEKFSEKKVEVESLDTDVLKHYKKRRGTGSAHKAMWNLYTFKVCSLAGTVVATYDSQ